MKTKGALWLLTLWTVFFNHTNGDLCRRCWPNNFQIFVCSSIAPQCVKLMMPDSLKTVREVRVLSCTTKVVTEGTNTLISVIRDRLGKTCSENVKMMTSTTTTAPPAPTTLTFTTTPVPTTLTVTSTKAPSAPMTFTTSTSTTTPAPTTSTSTAATSIVTSTSTTSASTMTSTFTTHASTTSPSVTHGSTTTSTSTPASTTIPTSITTWRGSITPSVLFSEKVTTAMTKGGHLDENEEEDGDLFNQPASKGFLAWAITSTLTIIILILKRCLIKKCCACSCDGATNTTQHSSDTPDASREHIPLSEMSTTLTLSDTPDASCGHTQLFSMHTPPSQSTTPDVSSNLSTPQLSPISPSTPSSTKPLLLLRGPPAQNTRSKKTLF